MIHYTVRIFQIVAVFGTVSSGVYYLLCLWSVAAFLRERENGEGHPTQALPPVTILKPLKGNDPEMYESLRSHCLQDYPEYEIIFGVSDANDPAANNVQQLQQEFPTRRLRLVVCPKTLGANGKVSTLAQMMAIAGHHHLIVNDSDIRVDPDYLRRVVAPLANARVGMVTCLYRGVADATLGARLESLGIGTDFCVGVLVARQIEGLTFALGSTMAFRRTDLEKIGGFESFVDYLSDDYELGKRISDLGLEIKLSPEVVETYLPAYSVRGFFAHQLRWARGVRDSRPGGYFGLLFTFGLLWSVLALLTAGGAPWAWMLLGVTFLLRLAVALMVGRVVLRDRDILGHLWLLPLRDLIAVGVWIASFAGHTVTWRGDRFRLKAGRLVRIDP